MNSCEVAGCDQDAQTFIDIEVIYIDDDGVSEPRVETLAVCRLHALREQLTVQELG